MKRNSIINLLFFMLICGVASSIISSITFKSFASFEIFYFGCMLAGILMLLLSRNVRNHVFGGIIMFCVGFFVNAFVWSVNNTAGGTAKTLNLVMTMLVFITAIVYVHAFFSVGKAKKFFWIFAILTMLATFSVIVFQLSSMLSSKNSLLLNATILVQNLSLLSTMLLPVAQLLSLKSYVKK